MQLRNINVMFWIYFTLEAIKCVKGKLLCAEFVSFHVHNNSSIFCLSTWGKGRFPTKHSLRLAKTRRLDVTSLVPHCMRKIACVLMPCLACLVQNTRTSCISKKVSGCACKFYTRACWCDAQKNALKLRRRCPKRNHKHGVELQKGRRNAQKIQICFNCLLLFST